MAKKLFTKHHVDENGLDYRSDDEDEEECGLESLNGSGGLTFVGSFHSADGNVEFVLHFLKKKILTISDNFFVKRITKASKSLSLSFCISNTTGGIRKL